MKKENNHEKLINLSLTALMTAVIVVCSFLTIPLSVPITLQTFAVFSALLILGGKKGTASVTIYILLGAVGLPVFSGFRGGIGHILGATGGYIIGFIFIGVIYTLFEQTAINSYIKKAAVLIIGLIICYLFGSLWFYFVYVSKGKEMGFGAVLLTCVVPFIIPDIIKLFAALLVSDRIKKALKR